MTERQAAERVRQGTWIGVDRNGTIQAAHVVYDNGDEGAAWEFVTDGGLTAFRVGPDVAVRLGEQFDG